MKIRCQNRVKTVNTKKMQVFLDQCSDVKELEPIRKAMKEYQTVTEEKIFPKEAAIVCCGYPSLYGSAFLAKHCREDLTSLLPLHFLETAGTWYSVMAEEEKKIRELLEKQDMGIVYPLGEGGLYRALYQIGKDSQKGFQIQYKLVPVKQESIEICEFYDVDPWSMFSAGSMLIVTETPGQLLKEMEKRGWICARIGYMTRDRDKVICHEYGKSRINRPQPDALLQILQRKAEET